MEMPLEYKNQDSVQQALHRDSQSSRAYPSRTIIHAKLEMTEPDDHDEQEADAVANTIVSGGKIARKISGGGSGSSGIAVSQQMESQLSQLQGGGRQMPEGLRNMMESGFGQDFSQVRLHTDSEAASMSSSIHAKAFTLGKDIYFNRGQFSPETSEGQRLVAHELTHVVQGARNVHREMDEEEKVNDNNTKDVFDTIFDKVASIKDNIVDKTVSIKDDLVEKVDYIRDKSSSDTIDSNFWSVMHYYIDNSGKPVHLSEEIKNKIFNSPDMLKYRNNIKNGTTISPAYPIGKNLKVNMRGEVYFVGNTPMRYETRCDRNECETIYIFEGDGFWDIFWGNDKTGSEGELLGTPYPFKGFEMNEKFKNPGYVFDEYGVPYGVVCRPTETKSSFVKRDPKNTEFKLEEEN